MPGWDRQRRTIMRSGSRLLIRAPGAASMRPRRSGMSPRQPPCSIQMVGRRPLPPPPREPPGSYQRVSGLGRGATAIGRAAPKAPVPAQAVQGGMRHGPRDVVGGDPQEQAAHAGRGADAQLRRGSSRKAGSEAHALGSGGRKRARSEEDAPPGSLAPVHLPAFNPERLTRLDEVALPLFPAVPLLIYGPMCDCHASDLPCPLHPVQSCHSQYMRREASR